MMFLRAFGLTRFAESQQTRRPGASCAQRLRSTRFPQVKVKVSGIWDNCHCPASRLLVGVWYARLLRACTRSPAPLNRTGANERNRELALATRRHEDGRNRCVLMALVKVHGESDYGAHHLPAGRTAAERRERGRPAGQVAKIFEG